MTYDLRSYEQQLTDFYRRGLGRDPDEDGWNHYMGQLQGGRSADSIRNEIYGSQEARDRNSQIAAQSQAAARAASDAQAQAQAYANQISGYQQQLQGYQNQISGLQNQYQTAMGQVQSWQTKAGEYQTQAADWEDQFNKRTVEWEEARDEAQMYRDQAVGAQLRALRSGATAGGGNQTQGGGTLASGRQSTQRYDDKAIQIEKNIQAESGALSNKGPVVQRLGPNRSTPTAAQRDAGRPQGAGTGSYYASRFS